MSEKLYVITTFFNPANFHSLLKNYYIFRDNLLNNHNVELLTIELSFNGEFQIVGDNVIRLYSDSIMWQKERLINYGISLLPTNCKYFGWFDCDILFLDKDWVLSCLEKLQSNDIIQMFKRVYFAPKQEVDFSPFYKFQQSVIWQYKIHKNWLERRINKELPYSAPGFAFAARRDFFNDIGLYDYCITGSGDTALIDILLNSYSLHSYYDKLTDSMKMHLLEYTKILKSKKPRIDYLHQDILHLYHGSIPNRNYIQRHEILKDNNYSPLDDVIIRDNVFEWNTNKPEMHSRIKQYFFDRKEDL